MPMIVSIKRLFHSFDVILELTDVLVLKTALRRGVIAFCGTVTTSTSYCIGVTQAFVSVITNPSVQSFVWG